MADITQQLIDLAEKLRDPKHHNLTEDSYLCQRASSLISTYQDQLDRTPKRRFDDFFQAALTGILARNSGAHLMSNPSHLVSEARRIATLCVQAQPGEDS